MLIFGILQDPCTGSRDGVDFEPYARHNQFSVMMNVPSTEIEFAIFYFAFLPQLALVVEHVWPR
jgi:hypothetical protein